jgi:4-hydroxybenzoate polyprenyltransferase/phosphoserine phosphatase
VVASRAALDMGSMAPAVPAGSTNSIAVDLDNSLLGVDTLHEGLVQLLSRQPWLVFVLLLMVFRGKAALKDFVQKHAPVDVAELPVRNELLDYLREQKRLGRSIGLFSAAHQEVVDACSSRFGIFDVAVGTTGRVNLAGQEKLDSIKQHFGCDFVYAGDSAADLPIWREAKAAIYLGRSRLLRAQVANAAPLERDLSAPRAGFRIWAKALRVHQSSKNLLLFVPSLLSIPILTLTDVLNTALAFITLCITACTTYIINDLADVAADRQHPSKSQRPFACGAIPVSHGVFAVLVLSAFAAALMALLPRQCALTLIVYAAVSLSYTSKLKAVPILDVICLGFLFTIRIAAGASLLENNAPYWLYAFSMFFFTSLAFVKRYTELALAVRDERDSLPGRTYQSADLPLVLSAGLGSALCSIVVFLIYLAYQHFDASLFRNPAWLGFSVASVAYWLLRAWLVALRGEMHDDPVVFALKDRTSYVLGGLVGLSLFLAW